MYSQPPEKNQRWMVFCAIKLYKIIVFLDNVPYRPPPKKIKNDINDNKTKTPTQPTYEMMMMMIIIIIIIITMIIVVIITIIIIIIIYYCCCYYYNINNHNLSRYRSYSSLHAHFDSDIRLS